MCDGRPTNRTDSACLCAPMSHNVLDSYEDVPNMKTGPAPKVWWIILGLVFASGIVLWLGGVAWGAALPGVSLLGFVIRAWLDVRPQGVHVYDTGLRAYRGSA